MGKLLDQIEELGYSVEEAMKVEDTVVYRIEGNGISTLINSDDQSSLKSILNEETHEERVRQSKRKE